MVHGFVIDRHARNANPAKKVRVPIAVRIKGHLEIIGGVLQMQQVASVDGTNHLPEVAPAMDFIVEREWFQLA
jgi:hypothetical protein